MAQHGEHDAQILQAAVARGLISDTVAVAIGGRATIDQPVETLLVSDGYLSQVQVTTMLGDMAAARVEPPTMLGNYRIIDKLGQGGMATVYKAEQLSLNRVVALKIIGPPHTQNADFCDRFLREARLVAAINHPNVITCFDAGQDKGFLYMALELVTGGDAGKAVTADGGRLEEKRALAIASDCCQGLIALDAGGLIHRDVKPGNIFLCPTPTGERAKLADLGLARAANGDDLMTATGASMGTPAFMSPEQANGTDVDIRTDIYALGATLYALLTGKSPYQGTTVWSVMAQVLKDPVPDPRGVQPAISNASASVVIHCLSKDRTQRYATPLELLEDLEAAAGGRPLKHAKLIAHPSRSWEPLATIGPMPRHVTRDHPTVHLSLRAGPNDRPRDDLGIREPRGQRLWLVLSAIAIVVVATIGIIAAKRGPLQTSSENDPPALSIEADLPNPSALADDPLRPRPTPEVVAPPAKSDPAPVIEPPVVAMVPAAPIQPIAPTIPPAPVALKPLAPNPAPPAVVIAAEPGPPIPIIVAQPEVTPKPVAPVPPDVIPPPVDITKPEVIAAVEVAPTPAVPNEEPGPAEIPAPAGNPQAANIAYIRSRENDLNRNGFRCSIEILPTGTVAVTILDKTITELDPLRGLAIERLDASNCDRLAGDLSVLTDMPLRRLTLTHCKRLTSLRGVRGAAITELSITGCTTLGPDLSQLTAAKLSGTLDLTGCLGLTSLEGLQKQGLTEVIAKNCTELTTVSGLHGSTVRRLDLRGCTALTSLTGLDGVPLEELRLDGAKRLTGDLRMLRGAPLRILSLRDCGKITDLDGIQGARLTEIDMHGCNNLVSIVALKGSMITLLDLTDCAELRNLDGLQGVPLVELKLYGCRSLTGDFTAVRGAPLQVVDASYCSQMTSLRGLEQSPLRKVILTRNTGISDYAVLAGIKGLEIDR